MTLVRGQRVLRSNFTLSRNIFAGPYELWEADPGDGESILIKAWPFADGDPTLVERSLWDRELRTLYRLASTRDAQRHLVTLVDAAFDREARAFVLALKVPGFDRLSEVLSNRRKHAWLSDLSDVGKRTRLWRASLQLIEGLAHVHSFRSVHRAVLPEHIFLDASQGAESMRLGGFEWSIRLGEPARNIPLQFLSPIDRATASLNADWRDLGLTLAALFGAARGAIERGDADQTSRAIRELPRLNEDERRFLRALVDQRGSGALERNNIIRGCKEIIESLEGRERIRPSDRFGVVAAFGGRISSALANKIAETDETITATADPETLRRWLENDLSEAEIISSGSNENPQYFLKGRRLPYKLYPFKAPTHTGERIRTWTLGYLERADYLHERNTESIPFPAPRMVQVYTTKDAWASFAQIKNRVRSWEAILMPPAAAVRESLPQMETLRNFLAVTNEIERAIRKTEIFPVRRVDYFSTAQHEFMIVEEVPRHPAPIMMRASGSQRLKLADYLINENAKEPVEVYLGPEGDLKLERWTENDEHWLYDVALPDDDTHVLGDDQVLLRRAITQHPQHITPPGKVDFLRTRGMRAQVQLLERREQAIQLLGGHLFLQRAIVLPDTVYMDTRIEDLPLAMPDEATFDIAKRDAIRRIWRTRPIYCLQGPPGTGKTTLVAQLLRQIFHDDPSCQVLLTAQAHSAVDHLRDQVQKFVNEMHRSDGAWVPPIAIRLRRLRPGDENIRRDAGADSASLPSVAGQILGKIADELEARSNPSAYIQAWLDYVKSSPIDGDFTELVRRSANFVYCTSTAQDLLDLARSNQTFDWSIIEEAGKAHGFDLVLPLQTGHRWLLIGDQNQLPPYRQPDFLWALDHLTEICGTDPDLRRFWEALDDKPGFVSNAKSWLFFFRELYRTAERRINPAATPLVGMLTEQHRMHPYIGDMISYAFYDGRLKNGTVDAFTSSPMARVSHQFIVPSSIVGHSIVWIDVERDLEWPRGAVGWGEQRNPLEAVAVQRILQALEARAGHETLAVLTPYRLQIRELRQTLQIRPTWATMPEGRNVVYADRPGVFTVDSFQGRQASVVVVSLVRNNTLPRTEKALGFLKEYERMNVMMSRAEKLLILVGAWSFFRAHLMAQSDISGQPFAELARLIRWFDQAFSDNRALLVSAADLDLMATP